MPLAINWPNRFDGATLSDPYWTTGLPLSYLLTRQISQVARALSTTARFYAAFPSAISAGVAALAGHNFTTSGQWRLRGFAADPRPIQRADLTITTLPAWLTFSRASSAHYWGADGLLKLAATNEPRWDSDPSTGALRGLLLEPSGSNVISHPRDGTNAAWTQSNMTRAKTATGIDGVANSATRLTATAANATLNSAQYNQAGVWSIYVRRVSGSGTVNINAGAGDVALTGLGSTWQRFSGTQPGGLTTLRIQIVTSGDVIEFDFAQVESGTQPTTPMPVTAGVGSRGGDALSRTLTDIGAASAATLQLRFRLATRPATAGRVFGLNGTGTTFAGAWMTTAGVTTARVDNTTTQADNAAGTLAVGDTLTLSMSWALNDVRSSANGAAVVSDTSATVPALTTVAYGQTTGIWLQAAALYAGTRTSAELVGLSGAEMEIPASSDTGLVNAWPAEWVSATTAEERVGVRGTAVQTLASNPSAQWWRIDLVDPTNPAGYVELGRVFLGARWRPERGALTGATIGYIDRASSVEADSGAEYFVERPLPRVAQVDLVILDEAVAMSDALDLQRALGTTGELLFQWDDNDTTFQPARCFLGRLRTLQPLTCLWRGHWRATFEVKELL